jgi:hypothetical protein
MRRSFGIVFAATLLLTACASSQQFAALGSAHAQMVRDARSGDLVYVATGDNVYVLTYPNGKLVGSLGISGYSLCSDTKGDVFVPTSGYEIAEYSHDGKPLQTLQDMDTPLGCAVDPTTGNLAVTNAASGAGEVAIYPNSQAPPQYYRDSEIGTFGLCGYDAQGNLFVDGTGNTNVLAELPKGSEAFDNHDLGRQFDTYDSTQWDGTYVTLSNPSTHAIYRVKLSPSVKVVGTTHVHGWHNAYYGHWPYVQTWLQNGTFIAQWGSRAELGIWSYPSGGSPDKVIGPFRAGSVTIHGVTLSVAPR